MSVAARLALCGVVASSAGDEEPAGATTVSYTFSGSTKPPGIVDKATTAGAGASLVTSGTLQEGNSSTSNGGYNSLAVFPDEMASSEFEVTVTVGSLSSAANNRAVGGACASADGTVAVYCRVPSSSGTAVIGTYVGGVETDRATLSSQSAVPGNTITLTPSVSGGVVTWTVTKNGAALGAGLSWTDSGHLVDLPGVHPAVAFRHQYSAGQYPSRGVTALSAEVI